jgi:hypothetical protein
MAINANNLNCFYHLYFFGSVFFDVVLFGTRSIKKKFEKIKSQGEGKKTRSKLLYFFSLLALEVILHYPCSCCYNGIWHRFWHHICGRKGSPLLSKIESVTMCSSLRSFSERPSVATFQSLVVTCDE